jgi:hypothetical protein
MMYAISTLRCVAVRLWAVLPPFPFDLAIDAAKTDAKSAHRAALNV